MDEASKQITSDVVNRRLPMGAPDNDAASREDHHYQRQDVRAVFLFFDPLCAAWRRVAAQL